MIWTEVIFQTDEDTAEEISELIRPFGQNASVVTEQLGDPDDLNPDALLPQVYLKIYLSELADTPDIRTKLRQIALSQGLKPPAFTQMEEKDWSEAWKAYYEPFPIGINFWIYPEWEPVPAALDEKHVIRLDPGLAFGTGQHETTQLCLEALEDLLEPGMKVLDLGTGSGVLAIGAAKLGAGTVVAIDNDPVAVRSAADNAAMNQVKDSIHFATGSVSEARGQQYDLLLVNILAAVIVPMIREENLLALRGQNGLFVFSGIVTQQREEFLAVLESHGGVVREIRQKNDWIVIIAQ
ncbi:MAG: 50S ribosomal protein L11 methyltransferase [Ardenticatenaceae bacterium]|nr:50S ribosomal protein L11 methyltransferase [Ardenticatenaceae bacterium]